MHPYCFICAEPSDPVKTPIARIACGHTLCMACINYLMKAKMPCSFCNDSSRPLCHRDIRTLAVSVIKTSVDEDQAQVHLLIQSLLQERDQLFQTTSANNTKLKTSSKCVKNQFAILSRLFAKADWLCISKKRILSELEEADSHLLEAIENHDSLLTELAAAEQRLREAGRLAGMQPSKVRLPYLADTPSYVRGMKQAREEDHDQQHHPAQQRRLA